MSSNLVAGRDCMRSNQDVRDMSRTVDDEIEWSEADRKDTLGKIETLPRSTAFSGRIPDSPKNGLHSGRRTPL